MNASSVSRYIVATDEATCASIVSELAEQVSLGKAKFIDLVQLLGEYLIQDDDKVRASAVRCMAETLKALPKDFLTRTQMTVIVEFFCDRLQDSKCVTQVADGLTALAQMQAFKSGDADLVVERLGKDINMKQHLQNARYTVLRVLKTILDRFSTRLDQPAMIRTYVSLTSGEKDPRNLIMSFSIARPILATFELTGHEQDLFDVVFCYFPITFEPPKDDPYGITAADLKLALRACISASPALAQDSISGLLDKLNSSSESVKLDTLDTLLACLASYGPAVVEQHWQEIWDGLKYEILHGAEEGGMVDKAGEVLQYLAVALESTPARDKYLEAVQAECREKLNTPSAKLALPAALLCTFVARSSAEALRQLEAFNWTLMAQALSADPTVDTQVGVLQIVLLYVDAAEQVRGPLPVTHVLAERKDDLVSLFMRALKAQSNPKQQALGVTGLSKLGLAPGLLTEDEQGLLVQQLTEVILKDEEKKGLSEDALKALTRVAEAQPEVVIRVCIPELVMALTSTGPASYILSCLATLCVDRRLYDVLLVRLVAKVEEAVKGPEPVSEFCLAILTAILAITRDQADQGHELASSTRVAPRVLALMRREKALQTNQIADVVAHILMYIVRTLKPDRQSAFAAQLEAFFVSGADSELGPGMKLFESVDLDSDWWPRLVLVYALAISPVASPSSLSWALVQQCIDRLQGLKGPFERRGCLVICCLAANRLDSKTLDKTFISGLDTTDVSNLEALAWLAKGLVLKNDRLGFELAATITGLLANEQVGTAASHLFAVFVSDSNVLAKENGLLVRPLYRQRLFSQALPQLVQGFQHGPFQVNYLVALAGLLRYTPSKVVLPQLGKVFGLLLESLTVPDPRVQEAVVGTMFATLYEAKDIFAQHMSTIVPGLLKVAQSSGKDTVGAKTTALRCLAALPAVVSTDLEPFRKRVLRELEPVLDDPRRQVRREAINCRQRYYE